jgi:hypothetical protein
VSIGEYQRVVHMGDALVISISVTRPTNGHAIVQVRPDLEGDGRDGWPVGWSDAVVARLRDKVHPITPADMTLLRSASQSLENVRAVTLYPKVIGNFNLVLTATTADGCVGVTGLRRDVQVTP